MKSRAHPRSIVARVAAVIALLWMMWLPGISAAQVEGPCTATFNGVDVDRIDSLSSPLELDATDTLVFAGIDRTGTQEVAVGIALGPITIDTGTTTYGPVQEEYAATLDLENTSPYGVGLYRINAETDDCVVGAWLRVTGRHPMATLTGLTAAGLAVGGVTGQITAAMSRRRLSPLGAAIAGLATGAGIALLGQQFGRMQISYPSLMIAMTLTALIGFFIAWLLRAPEERGSWRREQAARERIHPKRRRDERSALADEAEAMSYPGAAPSMNGNPYWCYVMAPVDVFDLNDHTRVIANLQPGTWYLAKREVSGWVHIVAREGAEGWVAQASVHRQG